MIPCRYQPLVETHPDTLGHVTDDLRHQASINGKRCLTDLYYLITEVLYYGESNKYGPMHKWMCEMVGKEKRQLWLLPRDHFKSTILTIGYCIQCILNDPWESNLILSSKDEHAYAFSEEIKKHFVFNKRLRAMFGPWCPTRDWDAKGEWTSPAKAFFGGRRREPTVVATGFKSRLASRHYKRGFLDDVIEEADDTEANIASSVENFKKVVPLIDKDGWIIMPGTRKHYNDLYNHVIRSGAYSLYIRHGLEHEKDICEMEACANTAQPHKAPDFEKGLPLEPARYNREDYDQKLRECEIDPKRGVSYFWHEYMNVPFSPADQQFQPEWFTEIDDDMIPGKREPFHPLNKYLALDSAWKEEEHPSGYDYNVIIPAGFDDNGRLYILDIMRDRTWTMKQGSDVMITLMKAYGISRVITEKIGQVTFHTYFRDRCRQAGIPVVFITPKRQGIGAKGKKARIMSSQGYFEQGKVFFRRDIAAFGAARDEFCNLGRWTNDDIADAIADFFDEQVKQLSPPVNTHGGWKTPGRPVSYDTRSRKAAFAQNDPLGRFGALGPAETKMPLDTSSWGISPNKRKI